MPASRLVAVFELLKPITWFPPMWAFVCGVVSIGQVDVARWPTIVIGVLLAGPLVCGASQAANDWFDRDVDAINEPRRPIPSGRLPNRAALYFAIAWTLLALGVATRLGAWGFGATVAGVVLAWAYSAPPLRLKAHGWLGNGAAALCYEALPWVMGAVIAAGTAPNARLLVIAGLYSIGAHGIMTLNDFRSVRGDRLMGVASLPVQMGEDAAPFACFVMALAQAIVIGLLFYWGHPVLAGLVTLLWLAQLGLMDPFLEQPHARASWYNTTGVPLFGFGMLVAALALRPVLLG
jgi:chlorophyll synthase